MRFARLFAIAAASFFLLSACSRLQVVSDPPGATIVWSPNGYDDWRPWPPKAWADDPQEQTEVTTPYSTSGLHGDTIWITVRKDGYYRPLPKTAQLYALRRADLSFQLVETPESKAARLRSEGFVKWGGQWVRPEENDLVEYKGTWITSDQAQRLTQIANGMVEYEGEWLTLEEAAAREALAQQAKGLILFKDRWVTPEQREGELTTDRDVDAIAEGEHDTMDLPRVVGPVSDEVAQMQILNSTNSTVRILISGPQSSHLLLTPYSSFGLGAQERLRILPGRYEFAIVPQLDLSAISDLEAGGGAGRFLLEEISKPQYLEASLAGGFQYLINYDIETDFGEGPVETYKLENPELPIDLPEIEIPEIQEEEPRRQRRPGGSPRRGGGRPSGT